MAGVSDIQTDTDAKLCTFKLADPKVDIKAKLAEFAKTNTHIAGFEVVSGVN